MKLGSVLFFLALSCSACRRSAGRGIRNANKDFGKSIHEKIFDGRIVPAGKAPFMSIVYSTDSAVGRYHASAVIISDRYLLSTAIYFFVRSPSSYVAYLGETDLSFFEGKNKYIVDNLTFSSGALGIVLIKLQKRIEFNEKRRPIALLPPNDTITKYGENVRVDVYSFGFTKRNSNDRTVVLKTKKMSIPTEKLQKDFLNRINYTENVNSCPGDSGSPLIMEDKLVAINRYREICGDLDGTNFFIVTGISPYYDWILHQVGEEDFSFAQQNAYRRDNSVLSED